MSSANLSRFSSPALILSRSELCRSTFACSPVNRLLERTDHIINSMFGHSSHMLFIAPQCECQYFFVITDFSSFGRITHVSHYFHADHLISVGVFLVSPTIPLLPVASLMTVLFSLCPCRSMSHWNISKSDAQQIIQLQRGFNKTACFVCR